VGRGEAIACFNSDDGGASWQRVGRMLPEPNTAVRGIAGSEEARRCHDGPAASIGPSMAREKLDNDR